MSFDINISKINCSGKHGIYDYEKQNDQEFLVDINKVAKEEVGALVILKSAADKRPFKFVTRFEKGLRQYQDSLEEIRKILENI